MARTDQPMQCNLHVCGYTVVQPNGNSCELAITRPAAYSCIHTARCGAVQLTACVLCDARRCVQ